MDNSLQRDFLALVRMGIGHQKEPLSGNVDWQAIQALAKKQGLCAIVLDGVEQLSEDKKPPQTIWLQWIGEVLQEYECRYEQYCKATGDLAKFYNGNGYKMMVLKGYACSLNWPKPKHRPSGDIDIWLFGKQKEADMNLEAEKPVQVFQGVQEFKVDRSHHHHTVFNWNGFSVENHFDFVNVHAHRSSVSLEKVFKELGSEANLCSSMVAGHVSSRARQNHNDNVDLNLNSKGNRIPSVDVCGEKVYLPSPNLHALFLIRHMASHFAAVGITLRQVLDWAFFVEKHTNEVDWEWLDGLLIKYHMKDFFNYINAICKEDLGFDGSIFPKIKPNDAMKYRVLSDILNPQFSCTEPDGFVPRMRYKYKRWQGNAWKQELCYNESRLGAFWTQLWSHLVKP